jgi:hypothetical protein
MHPDVDRQADALDKVGVGTAKANSFRTGADPGPDIHDFAKSQIIYQRAPYDLGEIERHHHGCLGDTKRLRHQQLGDG